ncbi:MazG nucleotide pyrophosphohydrolase domain-containing protein [Microbacterium sp. C7(2022)]|uniref:MazG nucleotide pyrophosphohydrolase domain-containing protein n=1 Tax=Microbacterium sp. C7(2022) TaxID=2992759 RepID=UPI00237A1CF1|nr:MazG nucleotide pyrophosphohydrolase domain-containing protein [Microbacterium sp. C7(2022)]MDE0547682.1 nucleotide pyrophosphohydrolase [Microbacterium sp. C7(2022)]
MEFQAMQQMARRVAALYGERDVEHFGRAWTAEELVLGLVGDVGDLAKLAQGKAGGRPRSDLDAALEHELADCLWSLIAIADAFDLDLEKAFVTTMDELSGRLGGASEQD